MTCRECQEHYEGSFQQMWRYAAAEVTALRKGLQQIADQDYPIDAGDAATWAREVLADPAAVHWKEADA